MDDTTFNGLLAAIFGLHLTAFTWFWSRRHRGFHLALCGTFAALAAIYTLKSLGLAPAPGGVSVRGLLRVVALACTALALVLRLRSWRADRRAAR